LEKAFADGTVEILQSSKDLTRKGTGEHAEFYTDEQKVILQAVVHGTTAKMVQTPKNSGKPSTSEGTELTYFVNDDRLLVSGSAQQRATSRLRRK
jgi:lipopolysaccharide export system protein LptA